MRKLRINKKNNHAVDYSNTKCGEGTIMAALERVVSTIEDSELNDEAMEALKEDFEFLKEKLSFTPMQSMVVAMLVDSNIVLETGNMARYIGLKNISMLKYLGEIEELVKRQIVRHQKDERNNGFKITSNALTAFMKNEVYVPVSKENLTTQQLCEYISTSISECNNGDISYETMVGEVKDLLEVNPAHYLCKKVKGLQTHETILFFLCVTKYVDFGDLCVLDNEYQFMFPIKELSKIRSDIMSRRSPLFRDKLLSEAHDSGFASREGIAVSEEIKEYLDEELQLNWIVSEEKPIEGLLTHETIQQKHLYYNNEEQVAIEKLFKMLHNDHFTAIQERMTASGIRSGFACLFYGAPGTGKTETVLQLARETGRDIMQVNVASIRSKWVGDSEKNIRNIFKRYKNYCAKCKVKPILLFNEADAIINKRSTNVERSVDKMENAIQNIILEEMENLDGILIATTNLTSNIDTAFERRFIYKVEFHKPGVATKKHIWQSMINELNDSDAQTLASEFDLSGGQIENVMRKQFVDKILYDEAPTLEKLRNYCTQESMTSSSPHRTTIGFK